MVCSINEKQCIDKGYDNPSVDWSVCGSHYAGLQTVYKVIGTLGSGNQSLGVHGGSRGISRHATTKVCQTETRRGDTYGHTATLCNLTSQLVSSSK